MMLMTIILNQVNKILNSNTSYFVNGRGGCSKSTLINIIKQKIREFHENNDDDGDEEEVVEYKKILHSLLKIKLKIKPKRRNLKLLQTD